MNVIDYSNLPYSKTTSSGQIVWTASGLFLLMDQIKENKWIILGGDVLTCTGNYTCDSWYYNPDSYLSLSQNIYKSITVCRDYITEYIKRNGIDFLFSIVLSNSFLSTG